VSCLAGRALFRLAIQPSFECTFPTAERRQAMNLWAGSHKSHEDRAIILLSDRGSRPDCLA
jgi:hypothetical protein